MPEVVLLDVEPVVELVDPVAPVSAFAVVDFEVDEDDVPAAELLEDLEE